MKYLDFSDLLNAEPANLALLSTYQFDPEFFERYLLRSSALAKARRIVLFMDARQWSSLLRDDAPARFLNNRYLVVPVFRRHGVFHPKLTLLVMEKGGQVLCGSNNLTRSGCSSNLELLNRFTFGGDEDSQDAVPLAQEAFKFFRRACDDGEEEPATIGRAWIDEAAQSFPWLAQPLPVNGNRRVRLLHTYEGSLWDRLVAALDAVSPLHLLVISPFHDEDVEMFRRVRRRWPDCRVEVVVQQQVTNLPVKGLRKLQSSLTLSELRNSKRRLHAKLVAWEGKTGTGCLVGSANFTAAAFDARNVETCLQVADSADAVRSLFDTELPKRTIAFQDFEPGSEREPGPEEGPTTGLRLTSALLSEAGQLRVSYVADLPARPSSLRVAVRTPGESLPRATAAIANKERGTATINIQPSALSDSYGAILAFLVAESQGHREESAPIWVIQEAHLTYEPSGEGSSGAKQKVEETGEGLTELLEEIGKRDGVAAVAEYLRHLNIRFNDGGGRFGIGRKFRLRVHDPFHPDVTPEWLIDFTGDAENLAEAIDDFVERHYKRRLRKHATRGNINGMENFLDIFTAMVRLLYVYFVRSLGLEKKYVTWSHLIGRLCAFIEIATGGVGTETDTCDGFLKAISLNLNDAKLLREVSDASSFAANIRAALMIAQRVRFNPKEHSRPRNCLPTQAQMIRTTFAEVGLAEPSKENVLQALERYRMFAEKELSDFRAELESR
jgi:hypothetical protein